MRWELPSMLCPPPQSWTLPLLRPWWILTLSTSHSQGFPGLNLMPFPHRPDMGCPSGSPRTGPRCSGTCRGAPRTLCMSSSSLLVPRGPHSRYCVGHLGMDLTVARELPFPRSWSHPVVPPFSRPTGVCLFPFRTGVVFAKKKKKRKKQVEEVLERSRSVNRFFFFTFFKIYFL